jgi:hypothetical protein
MNIWTKKSKDAALAEGSSVEGLSPFTPDDTPAALAQIFQSLETLHDKVDRAPVALPGAAPGEADAQLSHLLFERMVLPMVEDLMAYYDRLQHVITPLIQAPELDAGARQTLQSLDAEVLDILARQHIERTSSDVLDPNLHQVRARIATASQALDRKIAKSHRCGFRRGSLLLRREEVDVYRYESNGG